MQAPFFISMKQQPCKTWGRISRKYGKFNLVTWCKSSSLWLEGYLILRNITYIFYYYFYVILLMISDNDWVCQPFICILNPGRALQVLVYTLEGWDVMGSLKNRWAVLTHLLLMFCLAVLRWQHAPVKLESGGVLRPCPDPQANEGAGFLRFGVWTLPPKRNRGAQASIR